MTRETRRTWCGMCHARCGILMTFENGKAVEVSGDPDFPVNRGLTCVRGRMMLEHLDHPDRLNVPLKRVGERGEGRWQEVSWQGAMDEIAARLDGLRDEFGAETLAMSRGTYRTYHWDARRFFNLFGSPNITGANPICYNPSSVIESAMCGDMPHPDLDNCSCAVILGSCRSVTAPVSHWVGLKAAKKRGVSFIVVDPRKTKEAEMADIWLQIKPGTDAALLLSWIHVIVEEELFDREFVDNWTIGFDDVTQLAHDFSPERVARETWISEELIRQSARVYAKTKPAVIAWGHGIDKSGPSSEPAIKARAILRALTGNLDISGGDQLSWSRSKSSAITNLDMEHNGALPKRQREKMLGAKDYPLFSFRAWEIMSETLQRYTGIRLNPQDTAEVVCAHPWTVFDAIRTGQPYPLRALICQAANPLLTLADPKRTAEALRKLDLLVVMDYYLTPTAAYADFVLPAAGTVERDDLRVSSGSLIAYPRALDPLYARRSDYEFWMELGRRLGQRSHWPWDTVEQVNDYRLAPSGLTFSDLTDRRAVFFDTPSNEGRRFGFGTPSGKVELASSVCRQLGLDPLPNLALQTTVRSAETHGAAFPLTLITGSGFLPMYHSEQRQWDSARSQVPDPQVSIHPQLAEKLKVTEGQWVRVETVHGSIRQRVHVTDTIHPKVVDSQHGWWFPERDCLPDEPYGAFESNANVLCSDDPEHCAKATGGWAQTGIACRIVPE